MTSISDYVDHGLYSPIVSGVFAAVADRYVLGRRNIAQNVAFGLSVSAGNLLADSLGHYVLPQSDTKTLEIQVLELGLSSGAGVIVDNLILEPGNSASTFARISTSVIARMAADYTREAVCNSASC